MTQRKKGRFEHIITEDILREEYLVKMKGTEEIGRMLGFSDMTIASYLRRYGIEVRKHGKPPEDLTGQTIGSFEILENLGRKSEKSRHIRYKCRCTLCQNTCIVDSSRIRKQEQMSCGCIKNQYGPNAFNWKGGKYISSSYIRNLMSSANTRGIEFLVTFEYIEQVYEEQNFKCALSGIDIYFAERHQSKYREKTGHGTASLDRIDSSKGYVEGNIQWVHKDINRIKWKYNQDYFIELCTKIAEHNKRSSISEDL